MNNITNWQHGIGEGDCLIQLFTFENELLVVYHEVIVMDPEIEANYRLVRSFSHKIPTGESGLLEINKVYGKLSKEAFEKAKELNWPCDIESIGSILLSTPGWEIDESNNLIYIPT